MTHMNRKPVKKINEILIECFEDIEMRHANCYGSGVTGTTSGYYDLDRLTGGFHNGELTVIESNLPMMNTAFALNIVQNAAKLTNNNIMIFSLKISEKQLINCMISAAARIDTDLITLGHLDSGCWEKLTVAIEQLSAYSIFIDDRPGITVDEIHATLKSHQNLGLIVIDCIQLIGNQRRVANNHLQEISEVICSIKQMARELNVPVVALSNRSNEFNDRPSETDLQMQEYIRQNADVFAFLRQDYYSQSESEKQSVIQIIIAKQHYGPTGTVELAFLKNYNKFVSLDRRNQQESATETNVYKKPDMYNASRK